MAFGVQNTLIKFFSAYTQKQQQDRFLSLMLLLPLLLAAILGTVGMVFYKMIYGFFDDENTIVQPLYMDHFYSSFCLILF